MLSTTDPLTSLIAATEQVSAVDVAMVAKLTQIAGDFAVNLAVALIILAATIFAARWASSATRKGLGRVRGFRHDPTVLSFAVQVVRVIVFLIGFIAVLQRLGVQTTSIIAVLGAASLAVGLALQGTLSNVAAGVMLLVLRPYRVGDLVNIGGNIGKVQRLDLFFTQIADANNVKIMAPNGKVFGDMILNLSGQKTRRMELKIGVGYRENLNAAKQALTGAAAAHEKVLPDPAPWCGVTNLLDSSVEMTLAAWCKSEDYWQTRADVFQAAKEALDDAGIEIPFPHQVAVPYGDEDLPETLVLSGLRASTNPRSAGFDPGRDSDQNEA
ncbi:mechanosensitive ion channel protein MscS [Brevundimonas sp. LM2]|uniref:mechanosensitive ion channel family protein n=1 Tax=Brevundimonas sp. LM2 TaxID=1938605 RepID=UPI000983F729|nr:mechanosensitive ion channel family protein [Brevundimonas sp. LM2]AQR61624.1 mechanosensitive ion channel protein MscS [Brevundimonas sp. LM2]